MLKNGQGSVMAGISEALVATGVGLLVAIPAVIAFNYFMRRVKVINHNTDVLTSILMSYLKTENNDDEPSKASTKTSISSATKSHEITKEEDNKIQMVSKSNKKKKGKK